jgi:hypothetical protein
MNGGLTYKDMDLLRAKAKAFDDALEYLTGRSSNEESMNVERILRRGLAPAREEETR